MPPPEPPRRWLMKSEPDVYSIEDLARDGRGEWEGVRNYQARNFMRDEMRVGDLVLFYHSNAKPPGLAGLARVCREGYPDSTQFDPKSPYFDPKAEPAAPRWFRVDLEHVETFERLISLAELREERALEGMRLLQRGQRLSVQPVQERYFQHALQMAGAKTRL